MFNTNSGDRFMLAGEFCSHDLIIVNNTESVVDSARLMKQQGEAKVLVVESVSGKNVPVCVLTNHDIVMGILAQCENIHDVIKNGIVSTSIIAREKEDLMIAVMRMKMNNVRNIPVVDSVGSFVGILSIDDIFDVITEHFIKIDRVIENSESNKRFYIH